MNLSFVDFCADSQGRTYADVIGRAPKALKEILLVLSGPDSQRRMVDSEIHHDRPALAGVVKTLESRPEVNKVMTGPDKKLAKRLRQATGAAGRIVMEGLSWKKTGRKGSVGVGEFFNKAEHYEQPTGKQGHHHTI